MADYSMYNNKVRRVTPIKIKMRPYQNKNKDLTRIQIQKSNINNSNNLYDDDDDDKDNNNLKFSCLENFYEFCTKTSLHGLKFVGDTKLMNIERIFFGISFTIGLYLAIYFIYFIYDKWLSTPVIIGFSSSATYINKIPFPALTICNMNQAQSSKVKDINVKTVQYSILQTLCSRESDFQDVKLNSTKDWTIYEKFLIKVAQPCQKMLLSCRFGSISENCSELFRTVITDEGLCCTFNTVDPSLMYKKSQTIFSDNYQSPKDYVAVDWTPEKNYPKKLPKKFYPRTAQGIGYDMGLSIVLDAQINEYHCSSTNGAGFKVLLHNPVEAPNVGSSGISIKIGHETRIVINPQLNTAANELRKMKRKYRHCIFENESNLTFYATYTRRNCESECESKFIANECNCVYYHMPRIPPNVSVCTTNDAECFDYASIKVQNLDEDVGEIDCNKECINSCFDLTFSPSSYTAPIGFGNFTVKDTLIQDMPNDYIQNNIAVIHFYYAEKAFRANIKEQFIGLTEFLSNTGGIIGLFLGFSVISSIEIIYFMTLRPVCVCKRMEMEARQNSTQNLKIDHVSTIFRRNYRQNLNDNHESVVNNMWRRTKKFKTNRSQQGPIFRLNNRQTLPRVLPFTE